MWNFGLNSIGVMSETGPTDLISIPPNYSVVSLLEIQNQNVDVVRVLKRRGSNPFSSIPDQSGVELIIKTGLVDIGITRTKNSRSFPLLGKVIGFRWSGGRLARRLNSDTELNYMLCKCLGEPSNVRIVILPEPIQGYLAIVVPHTPPTRELWNCYDKIAHHIREEIES